jgi:PTH1 family peptidyl-tRNA hydrolase
VGAIRLRPGGGSGGHNGLKHIAQVLGTTDFPRLRIGVGNDYRQGEQADYVLSRFTSEQKPVINRAIEQAGDAALAFVESGIEAAMNQHN